jgi:hypothetical protein
MYKSELQNLCCSLKYPDLLWEPCRLLFKGYFSSLRGFKQLGREAAYSPSFTTEITNEQSRTSNPPVRFHGLDRNSLTFIFCKISTTKVKEK